MRHDEIVFDFLKKLGRHGTSPLRGVPPIRRMKNYLAASGYAYEYYFEGYRDTPSAREYIFSLSGDRKNWLPISVLLPYNAIEPWQRNSGRTLADNERYAIAKLSLFLLFDETESPQQLPPSLAINSAQSAEIINRLGLD